MNRHSEIAAAVVAVINAAELGSFTAVRKVRPSAKREDLERPVVQVVLPQVNFQVADRKRMTGYFAVDVGVQQAIDADNLAAFDALLDLLYAIRGVFELKRLPGCEVAAWQSTETIPGAEAGFAYEDLKMKGIFTGVWRFTFMVTE